MGKLGKKARKFAKKHLQSVLRTRRKTKVVFKRRARKDGQNAVVKQVDNPEGLSNGRNVSDSIGIASLDVLFAENERDELADASDSDGYLSEDPNCPCALENEAGKTLEDDITSGTYSDQNKKILSELAIQKKKLDRLRKKDPEFSKFLESVKNHSEALQSEDEYSDDGESRDQGEQGEDDLAKEKAKILSNRIINTWCQMVKENHSQAALISLLNAYRAACHCGTESVGHMIENRETYCNILFFTLSNADDIFRGLMQISSSHSTKEMLLELKKTSKWKNLKPLVKTFVRSTLFLLNQVTDSDVLTFAMTRLKASLIFFVAFPSLIQRLLKATVHLWATGGSELSSASFLVIRDTATMFSSNYYDTCLSKTLVAFISQSRVTEIADIKHMQFLRDCVVELCSLDVQKSSPKAVASINHCAKILRWGIQTKKKEAVRRICSWEYVNCIDLWVRFISDNIRDYDFHSLFFMTTQLIIGLAHMFPGPRYLPLRLKSIEWLNSLSSSSGYFIPLASLVLDIMEYKVVQVGRKTENAFNIASVLKLPKHYLKSKSLQNECFHSAVEQLSSHFAQWSYHISFPDLATIPLICLRKVLEITTTESLRRMVKRLIDQVEQNVEFVQKKRDDASFSPHEQQLVDSFLQLEKPSLNSPFTQYYKSILEKAAARNLNKCQSLPKQENQKGNAVKSKRKRVAAGLQVDGEHPAVENEVMGNRRKKKATEHPAVENGDMDNKRKKKAIAIEVQGLPTKSLVSTN